MHNFWLQLRAIFLSALLTLSVLHYRSFKATHIGYIKGNVVSSEFIVESLVKQCHALAIKHGGPVDQFYFAPDVSEVHRLIEMTKDDLEYTSEVYDCDDFSRHFKDRLLHQWAKEHNRVPLPIVEIYASLLLSDGEVVYHAFNAIITNEGKLIYIEPQGPLAIRFVKVKLLIIEQAVV
jgi:hypothetical protein